MPDEAHEEALALIHSVADERERGAGPMTAADAVLRGRCWIVYAALGGLLAVSLCVRACCRHPARLVCT
ncbi:hypothetical protein AB0N81_10910 [Streptomyces sp. NPDC093510]|uniref:hypothetical protein n=1 Tax=Streptomyces sp. NPDC093510 TaxID=3155199 RepID=UPI003449EE35